MSYDAELSFMKAVFEKSRVHLDTVPLSKAADFFEKKSVFSPFVSSLAESIKPMTVYKTRDRLECIYGFLLLPEREDEKILVIGPYLSESISEARRLEIAENGRLSPKERRYLAEYYMTIPEIKEDSPLLVMLYSFCEKIWNTPSFLTVEIEKNEILRDAPMSKSLSESSEPSDTVIDIKTMESRYAFENEMIRAVELGLSQTEIPLNKVDSGEFFEKRASDPLRNAKNYGIIMNTLLRKAAERGGVHPIYLDKISSDFAFKLENSATVAENTALMAEMFRSYCRLVRKHRIRDYSLTVQKIILTIDADLSENLSAGSLAKTHGISLGYLSSVFKKETGKTVSEYIRERRMEYAGHLLSNTKLQIQTVAFNSGIVDVQYFSKIFKRHFGKTPSEYRLYAEKANKTLQYN